MKIRTKSQSPTHILLVAILFALLGIFLQNYNVTEPIAWMMFISASLNGLKAFLKITFSIDPM